MSIAFLIAVIASGATPGRAVTQKDCVGNPPRQTIDPLSPPCVPFFDADNGGATSIGVTRGSITVVLYNDLDVRGDIGEGPVAGDPTLVRTITTQLAVFNAKYQTYGRAVRVKAIASLGGPTSTAVQRRADAAVALAATPFATIYLGTGDPSVFLKEMALARVLNLGLFRHLTRSFLESTHPYVWTFLPDRTTVTALSAGFLCRKLIGYAARGAGDPTLRLQTRSIAMLRPADPNAPLSQLGEQLRAAVKARCGVLIEDRPYAPVVPLLQMTHAMLDLKLRGITTLVCYCDEQAMSDARVAATAAGYAPEWYVDDATGILDAGGTAHATFGITSQWRGGALEEQIPSAMYLGREPSGRWDPRWNATAYYTLLSLFNGLQSSGPNLTPESFERGQFTFNYLNLNNPFVPVGGYGPYNAQAMSNQSWIDTAMSWWWDPTGTPPDGRPSEGCRRLTHEGARRYPDGWEPGDLDMFIAGAPCTERVLP